MLLRTESEEVATELGEWWTRFQDVGDAERECMLIADNAPKPRRRRKRKSPGEATETAPE